MRINFVIWDLTAEMRDKQMTSSSQDTLDVAPSRVTSDVAQFGRTKEREQKGIDWVILGSFNCC